LIGEDNYSQYDRDTWYSLLIKSCNLTFTYRKKINKNAIISWNQDGSKISDLSNDTIVVTNANFNLKYKIDKNWTKYTSSVNSEIQILINDNLHKETIKLGGANETFKEAKVGGFDLTSLITDDVNISIQIFIANDFNLNQNITVSIDNATLEISYYIFTQDLIAGDSGGGGGTKYIQGYDYTPIIIGLVIGLIALVSMFGVYQKHYKYPPLVRKIRKLKKTIKKGKKLKSLIVSPREELIRISFKIKTKQILEEEFLQSEILNKNAKLTKNEMINKGEK